MPPISIDTHDDCPQEDCALVDSGLGEANDAAAPLHEVRGVSCFARLPSGAVVGGAVGRWWGRCCELQQLWVEPSHRRQGIGTELVLAFEAKSRMHGCTSAYLETFSFQAPGLYTALGYKVEFERRGYPHGIVKYHMVKSLDDRDAAA